MPESPTMFDWSKAKFNPNLFLRPASNLCLVLSFFWSATILIFIIKANLTYNRLWRSLPVFGLTNFPIPSIWFSRMTMDTVNQCCVPLTIELSLWTAICATGTLKWCSPYERRFAIVAFTATAVQMIIFIIQGIHLYILQRKCTAIPREIRKTLHPGFEVYDRNDLRQLYAIQRNLHSNKPGETQLIGFHRLASSASVAGEELTIGDSIARSEVPESITSITASYASDTSGRNRGKKGRDNEKENIELTPMKGEKMTGENKGVKGKDKTPQETKKSKGKGKGKLKESPAPSSPPTVGSQGPPHLSPLRFRDTNEQDDGWGPRRRTRTTSGEGMLRDRQAANKDGDDYKTTDRVTVREAEQMVTQTSHRISPTASHFAPGISGQRTGSQFVGGVGLGFNKESMEYYRRKSEELNRTREERKEFGRSSLTILDEKGRGNGMGVVSGDDPLSNTPRSDYSPTKKGDPSRKVEFPTTIVHPASPSDTPLAAMSSVFVLEDEQSEPSVYSQVTYDPKSNVGT
ncbi:hypothetical protein TREMEDRAFT_64903 [Tremella mesenterica DSM 1558]|uniref:uncharacterized protein n=1 Tax=Tremella mesenterica (strain ATCC 24925 / CBS 8224 / DSM 1558 / NBRC 9311 / NRRL Y-6157 / RJB 2259-6 / UBC 559-6) TaxID=578456 RepID=UPI0003F49191|nr:uncharacterized protein TREMEDRAFT_64903 [Tremella mesenterica DSM 1558]EIW67037.1 hypothetical protein TREMEDRAFT_64903 [Tremella mesenterica DSM 1558]